MMQTTEDGEENYARPQFFRSLLGERTIEKKRRKAVTEIHDRIWDNTEKEKDHGRTDSGWFQEQHVSRIGGP
jgi:hypothetical protein